MCIQGVLLPLLLHAGLCWSLPQADYFGGTGNSEANYDLYVDFEPDYYNSEPQAQPMMDDPPVFVEAGQHFQVGEGDSVIFNCATIKPSSNTMIIKKLTKEGNEGQLFYVGDGKIHRDRRIDLQDGLLNITMIRERDQGDYICYYEGNPNVQVIHTLAVKFAPKILFHSDDASVSQGDVLTLECIIEGNPEPRIEWERSEGLMPSGKLKEEGPVLKLDGINKNITGTYICKAKNELGTASETVSVTSKAVQDQTVSDTFMDVQDQITKIEKVITQTGWDSTLKLICTAPSGSPASFSWEKDGNHIEEDPNLRMNGDTSLIGTENGGQKSTLSLPLMASGDFGNYSCITENGLESTRSTIFVDDQPQEARFTSDPEGVEDTSYRLTWGCESNSPVIWYMVFIRNVLDESSELTNLGMFQNAEAIAEDNIYTISHELVDLTPGSEYEVAIQVNNKFRWSESSIFHFTTKRVALEGDAAVPAIPSSNRESVVPVMSIPASSRELGVPTTSQPISSRESAVPVMSIPNSSRETAVPTMYQPNSNQESGVPAMSRPSSSLDWCEWPLTTVGSECFFFSDILESEEGSRHKWTWENAQQFCEENGGNLAQPSSLNNLQQYYNQEKYWIGGRRVSRNDVRWLSGHLVRPDWIVNTVDSHHVCLQYWPSENRLGMGSCEENHRWICEKHDPFSQDLEINIFNEEEEVKLEKSREYYENQQEQTINARQEENTKSQRDPTVNVRQEDRTSQPRQPLYEQEQNKQNQHQTQEQQLQILEQQVQLELEQQQKQQRQQQSTSQQQTIPQQQEVIQKLTRGQLDLQKQQKLRQKQTQSNKVNGEPTIQDAETVQVEQRPFEQDTRREPSRIDTSAIQDVSTTNKVSVGGANQDVSTTNKVSVGEANQNVSTTNKVSFGLANQDVSTTNKESVGEYQPLRYMCPPNFLRLGNSCYYFGSEMATWHAAHFACRDRDSQMITLETQWEDITLRHYLSKPEFARLNRWVGGIYNWSTKRWMWGPSGQVMPYLGFLTSAPPTSSRWHCVFMAPSLNYRWNHELCTSQMHYICESPQSKIPGSEDISYAQ